MRPAKPSTCLVAARTAWDDYVYLASVTKFPRYAVGVERIPARDVIAYAKRGVEKRAERGSGKRTFGLVGYLEGLRRHYRGHLYVLESQEEVDDLRRELAHCQKANNARAELVRRQLEKEAH